jgi:hypothetical protein
MKAGAALAHASGSREKTLAGVGHKYADADHGKECCNYLDHRNRPLRSTETKRHGGPNSQKNSASRTRFAMQLMISGNRECQKRGRPLANGVQDGNIPAENRFALTQRAQATGGLVSVGVLAAGDATRCAINRLVDWMRAQFRTVPRIERGIRLGTISRHPNAVPASLLTPGEALSDCG